MGQAFYRICPSVCCAIHGPVWRSVRSSVDSGPALHVGCSLAQLIASLGTLRFLRSLTTHDRPSTPIVSAIEKANSRRHATISHAITEESAYVLYLTSSGRRSCVRNGKATLPGWIEPEKAEGEDLSIVRSASAVACTYGIIISYHRVCCGAVVED